MLFEGDLTDSERSQNEGSVEPRGEGRISDANPAPSLKSRGTMRMAGKRDGRAGQVRSAVAEDRESGAGAGRLFGRLLSPTVTTVTRRALAIVPKAGGAGRGL